DEGSEPDSRQVPRPAGGDVAEQVGDHALRQVVGLDAIGDGEALQLRHQPPVAADHAAYQPLVAEMIESALLAVALARGIDQREIVRLADRLTTLLVGRQVALLERPRTPLGEADADEAAGRDGVAVADEANRLGGADDLAGLRRK